MARREFEDRIEETAEKASKVIEQPPDEMKPRAKEAMAEYIQELEQLYNLLVITDQLKADIANNKISVAELRTEGKKKDKSHMRKEGLKKVASGITSLEELKRVV